MAWFVVSAVLGAWTWCAGIAPDSDGSALNILVTAFSILAGVLIVLMTFCVQTLYAGNWRIASQHYSVLRGMLYRHGCLFCAYLLVIGLALAADLWDDRTWIPRAALSLGVFAFAASFRLPLVIVRIQLDHLKEEVRAREGESGQPS